MQTSKSTSGYYRTCETALRIYGFNINPRIFNITPRCRLCRWGNYEALSSGLLLNIIKENIAWLLVWAGIHWNRSTVVVIKRGMSVTMNSLGEKQWWNLSNSKSYNRCENDHLVCVHTGRVHASVSWACRCHISASVKQTARRLALKLFLVSEWTEKKLSQIEVVWRLNNRRCQSKWRGSEVLLS